MDYVTDNEPARQEVMRIIDTTASYYVTIRPLNKMTEKQQGALHVWFAQCAHVLNEVGLLRERPNILGDGSMSIPWNKDSFKMDIYKVVLDAATGKKSTMDQDRMEPSDIAQTIAKSFYDKRRISLPPWPSLR